MKDAELAKSLLELKPEKWLCPYCGEWHTWDKNRLCNYGFSSAAGLYCPTINRKETLYCIGFTKDCFAIKTTSPCNAAKFNLSENIQYSEIEIDVKEKCFFFTLQFKPEKPLDDNCNKHCWACKICNLKKLADKRGNNDEMPELEVKFGFKFSDDSFDSPVSKCHSLIEAYNEEEAVDADAKEKEKIVRKLIKLKPTRYLCHNCGRWHEWSGSNELSYYSDPIRYTVNCPYQYTVNEYPELQIYLVNNPERETSRIYMMGVDLKDGLLTGDVVPLCAFELDKTEPQIYDKKRKAGFEFDKIEYDAIVKSYFVELRNANN